jgi:hypothetical protein
MGSAPVERIGVRFADLIVAGILLVGCGVAMATPEVPTNRTAVVLVVGAPGATEYGSNFVRQAALWRSACTVAGCPPQVIGLDDGQTNDYARLKDTITAQPKQGLEPLWIVLIGHGTFDGKEARFNLRGPDVTATDLAQWLVNFRRPLAVINTASASAPFINKLSSSNRVVITATRSGYEQNYAHFGEFMAVAIADEQADLDKDGEVSLLEAFLMASRRTTEFYKEQGRLATEHALIDDNGDGLGTPAEWFRGLRATKRARDGSSLDGLLAQQFHLVASPEEIRWTPEQRAKRDGLESAVLLYRDQKAKVPEAEYYRHLEKLLLDLARFYAAESNPAPSR